MIKRNFILATAGHVDHGKSSLVKALTGIDPDRLPEEKARGITIDLGFAHLDIPGSIGPEPALFHLGIVDVPGHEDFVKNMVAGVGSIDLALLMVAADDGWMPQTEEHLQILTYLGVTRAVVAVTKIDLAENEAAILTEIRSKLAHSPFADAPLVGTSIVSGRGLTELKGALAAVLEHAPVPRDIGKPRVPVDRVFMLRGIGTVVTGTLTGGVLQKGMDIAIQPRGISARVRSLQNHNREVEESRPGTRTALNVPDPKGPMGDKVIQRGDVVTLAELGEAGKIADVVLEKSGRLSDLKTFASRPLKDGTRVRIHIGSGDVAAHVLFFGNRSLSAGGRSIAQLRFEEPVFAFAGDRFIVRDWPEQATLAGGVILDADPPQEKFELRRHLLEARAESPADVAAYALTEVQRFRAMRAVGVLVKSRFSAGEISGALERLTTEKRLFTASGWVIDLVWWEQVRVSATRTVETDHQAHSDRQGMEVTAFRNAIEKELLHTELFDLLLRDLARAGFVQSGAFIRKATHQLALPPHLQPACARVRVALSAKPFDPPSRKELAPDALAQQALRFLIQSGEAIALAEDVVLLSEHFKRAAEQVRIFLKDRSATASELRQALGTSRRVLIPFLEQLDRDGVTRRQGDKRVLLF